MSVRLGFVGAGGIASRHLETLDSRDDATVAAVCDLDRERAVDAAEPRGATAYTAFDEMYETEALDAVFVCVPPFAHGEPELGAVERGIDLFVEKPLGVEASTAAAIHRAVEDSGILTQVGYMNRYADVVERAAELVEDRTLAHVDGHWWSGVPGTAWWGIESKSGGQVIEQATHTYDVVRYFAGDVERVQAAGGQRVVTDEIDFPDTTSATMTHENGVVSHVSATSASTSGAHQIRIVGDGVSLVLDLGEGTLTGTVDGERVEFSGENSPFHAELDAFLEAVRERDAELLRSPYADARKTFETTLTVTEAIDSGVASRPGDLR